jgi:hypothetical protein
MQCANAERKCFAETPAHDAGKPVTRYASERAAAGDKQVIQAVSLGRHISETARKLRTAPQGFQEK